MEGIGLGIIIGLGLAGLTRITRPTAKRALKLGFIAVEKVKGALGEGKERLSDLLAEVREEMAQQPHRGGAVGADASVRFTPEPPAN